MANWISFKDKEPTKHRHVIVRYNDGERYLAYGCKRWFYDFYIADLRYYPDAEWKYADTIKNENERILQVN